MTKKRTPCTVRYVLWFGLKLVVSISIVLCIFALLRFHSYSKLQSSFSSRRFHRLNQHYEGPPKIAFLFLARRDLPLDFLWGSFFENADAANFSIYIHTEPGFIFDESTTRSPFFYGRQLNNSVKVMWGESSMIEAERLLIGAALEDPANQRFVLLSDSCVPLYNFSYIYDYVMSSPRSFVDSFLDMKEGRYNPKMSPVIPKDKWRKGSQWITLVRRHAEDVADDENIFSVFKTFCKCNFWARNEPHFLLNAGQRWARGPTKHHSLGHFIYRRPPVDPSKGEQNIKLQKQHNCIPDEHYVQTLLAMTDLEDEVERRTLTYTLWNQSTTETEGKAWHPVTFNYANTSPQQIKEIKGIDHVYYETELRTEWCRTNSTFVSCFLFARKFSEDAAMRLLNEGIVGSFDATATATAVIDNHS